jgi:hypothetical protein
MFNAAKYALTSRAAQAWANSLIARYGRVQDVKIDSKRKTLEVSFLLNGEASPIMVKVEDYAVETEGELTFVRATKFTSTRQWLQNFLTDHGHRRRIQLPPWAAGAL